MDMLCPECRGPLVTADGQTARCTIHGGQYQIMYAQGSTRVETGMVPAIPAAAHNPPSRPVVMCSVHPEVPSVQRCAICHAAVCATCDFAFPGGIHVCPACASTPQVGVGNRRKKTLIWSYVLAVWSSLGLAVLLSGALANAASSQSDMEALGIVIMLVIFGPSIAGTATAVGSLDRRLSNPAAIWVSVVWNSIILVVLLLLSIVGNMS